MKKNSYARCSIAFHLRCRITIAFLLLLLPELIITSAFAAQSGKSINGSVTKKIFVLHSYHNTDWTGNIRAGIDSIFDESGIAVEIYVEYLDSLRFPVKESFKYMEDLFSRKYGRTNFDVILLSDNNALEFVLSRRKFFPATPVVFCGINDFREEQLGGQPGITGINEDADIAGTIKLALRIMPDIKKFLFISDRTSTGMAGRKKLEQAISVFSGKAPAFELLDDITISDLQKYLKELPADSAVLLYSFQRDRDGRLFTRQEYYRLISGSCSVPVFTFWEEESLRHRITGGVMITGLTQGKRAAEYALRILKGESVSSLPFVMESPNRPILNYPALKQFNISKNVIPAGTIIRNEPETLYYRHKAFIWLASVFLILLALSNIILLVNIIRRKRAEKALRESEEHLVRIFDTSPGGIVIVDRSGKVTAANAAAEKILGLSRSAVTERTYNDPAWKITAADGDPFPEEELPFARVMKTGAPVRSVEHAIEHPDGKRVVLSVNGAPFRDASGNVAGMIAGITDITERKAAEKALMLSEEKYRDIFERAAEGIFQCTPHGKFASVNSSFARMLGYDAPDELINNINSIRDQMFVDEKEYSQFINTLNDAGSIDGFEHRFYRKDGSVIWICTNAHIVRDTGGGIVYFEGIAENISGRKNAEEEQAKLQLQLQRAQKMEALGTFVGGIAHDFNNILNIMLGYAALLQMELGNEHPQSNYVSQIVASAKNATNLTKNLLAFSSARPVILKNLNLNDHIQNTEKLLKRLLREDIILKKNLTGDDTSILGDPTQIDQILFNLATNARDAMGEGGTLTIETKTADFSGEYVKSLGYGRPGRYVQLSVSDTGTGMDNEIMQKIFDPFFTTKEVGKGTGLGLSTVYGIVKQHKGYINVYSELGIGTAFHIYIPISENELVTETAANGRTIKGGKEKILVAEDNDDLRKLIKTILEKYGYRIVEAADGRDALEKFRMNDDADLMIIDSIMPYKNGREVYEDIKRKHPGVKVLFTSGYTRDVILNKGIEDREYDFIAKPIEPFDLLIKVREILDNE